MLAKRIIPCLDVTAGRVVKGINFIGLRDAGDPVELAGRYNAQGADELVFLDITASSDARDIMADVVARTARHVFIPLTVGGGIRSVTDARQLVPRTKEPGADIAGDLFADLQIPGHDRDSTNRARPRQCDTSRDGNDALAGPAPC